MLKPMRYMILVALFAAGCSGSNNTVAPTPPATVAGGWSGTIEYTANGSLAVQAVVMDLTQAGNAVNGTYATNVFGGTVTGNTTTSSFSGTFTFNSRTLAGAACTGTFAVSGPASSAATLRWTSPAVTASCTGTPVSITIAAQRR